MYIKTFVMSIQLRSKVIETIIKIIQPKMFTTCNASQKMKYDYKNIPIIPRLFTC